MTAPKAARKDRFGNRYYPVPDNTGTIHDLPSWTRLAKLLYSGGLETWKLKSVAEQIAIRPDLQMLAADTTTRYDAVKQALDASRDKSNIGTGVHSLVHLINKGTLAEESVPEAAKPYLDRYRQALADHGITVVLSEVTVANFSAGYAGTADQFITIKGETGVLAADVKTGDSVYPETALQLAAYGNAETIWKAPKEGDMPAYDQRAAQLAADIKAGVNVPPTPSGRARTAWNKSAEEEAYRLLDEYYWECFAQHPGRSPMPEGIRTDIGIVIHLHADKCELIPIRLDGQPSAFDVVASLCWIFRWQARGDVIGDPINKHERTVDAVSTDGDVVHGGLPQHESGFPGSGEPASGSGEPANTQPAGRETPISFSGQGDARRDGQHKAADRPTEQAGGQSKEDRRRSRLALERPGTPENHAVNPEHRYSWLRDRLQKIAATNTDTGALDTVASRWPADTPTLKTFQHDNTHLDRITALLDQVETQHGLSFGPALTDFIPAAPVDLLDKLTAAFPGSVEVATLDDKQPYINWLRQVVERDAMAGERITASLQQVGLRKSLTRDDWTPAELKTLDGILRTAERAAPTAPGAHTQQQLAA